MKRPVVHGMTLFIYLFVFGMAYHTPPVCFFWSDAYPQCPDVKNDSASGAPLHARCVPDEYASFCANDNDHVRNINCKDDLHADEFSEIACRCVIHHRTHTREPEIRREGMHRELFAAADIAEFERVTLPSSRTAELPRNLQCGKLLHRSVILII